MLTDSDSHRACAEPLGPPPSRSFVLAALRALHLDTGTRSALSTSRSKQLKTPLTTPCPFRDDYVNRTRRPVQRESRPAIRTVEHANRGGGASVSAPYSN